MLLTPQTSPSPTHAPHPNAHPLARARQTDGRTYYYRGLVDAEGKEGIWPVQKRWEPVAPHLDLRPTDTLLDLGCAESLITAHVARAVAHARGVEIQPQRVNAARQLAQRSGVTNVTFDEGSIVDTRLPDDGYDIVLCLGIIQHVPLADVADAIQRTVDAARRQVVIRAPFFRRNRDDLLDDCANALGRAGEGPRGPFEITMHPTEGNIGGTCLVATRPGL
ncbi:MAG: methyltransferase domain-containing protein [Planctomycetota bacterium]